MARSDIGRVNHRHRSSRITKISELKNYLPEWTSAKRIEKRAVFTAIARAARLFAPKVDQAQWKKRKQRYKTWLFNNQKKKERTDMIKYGRKWTPRQVIYQQKREDEWSSNFPPPPEIQAQVACKKGPGVYGAALFDRRMLEAMRDESVEMGISFMKTKDWEDHRASWPGVRGRKQFGAGARDGGRQVNGGRKRIRKPAFELEIDGDGMPVLPDITETKLEEKKAIVRAFLTSHYRICSGIVKAVVPWSAIVQ
ncbi:hypothetical protein DFJ58DRAFT_850708, partial [Suillus subalutaceus]|uniref:uncharacterized protein n=1 Tax=Suillus subalutaceus TaxID=48586 RepID=UPI001B885E51